MVADVLRTQVEVGGADRLVRLLRVLGRALVDARLLGQVFAPVVADDLLARRLDRLARELHRIGAHVGDQADRLAADVHALIQALGGAHGLRGAHPQLARGFLLQRGGGEGRGRMAAHLLALDGGDGIGSAGGDLAHGLLGRRLRRQVELVELAPVQMRQPRGDDLARGGAEIGVDRPVFAGLERLDLGLALADQAQRDRLHPPRRARAGQLAPQHRRQGEADQVVERPARQVGLD